MLLAVIKARWSAAHHHRQAVRQRTLGRTRMLSEVDQDRSSSDPRKFCGLDGARHLRHLWLYGEASKQRLRGIGPGWRGPGAGARVVSGTGAAAGQRAVRGALHRAGSAGVLRRATPARLRRAMAGPERAAIGEAGNPADPELRSGRADCGIRRSLSAPTESRSSPGTPSESENVMRPSHSSTDSGISLSKDLWMSLVCPTPDPVGVTCRPCRRGRW
jgi:hypothetical protein